MGSVCLVGHNGTAHSMCLCPICHLPPCLTLQRPDPGSIRIVRCLQNAQCLGIRLEPSSEDPWLPYVDLRDEDYPRDLKLWAAPSGLAILRYYSRASLNIIDASTYSS